MKRGIRLVCGMSHLSLALVDEKLHEGRAHETHLSVGHLLPRGAYGYSTQTLSQEFEAVVAACLESEVPPPQVVGLELGKEVGYEVGACKP